MIWTPLRAVYMFLWRWSHSDLYKVWYCFQQNHFLLFILISFIIYPMRKWKGFFVLLLRSTLKEAVWESKIIGLGQFIKLLGINQYFQFIYVNGLDSDHATWMEWFGLTLSRQIRPRFDSFFHWKELQCDDVTSDCLGTFDTIDHSTWSMGVLSFWMHAESNPRFCYFVEEIPFFRV